MTTIYIVKLNGQEVARFAGKDSAMERAKLVAQFNRGAKVTVSKG